jgi:hypothetical protein
MQETFQCREIALLRGGDEGLEKALSLDRAHGCMTPIGDMFPGAADELTGVRFTEMKDVRDLPMRVVKRFSENIRGAFRGRELLQQYQDSKLQGFAAFCSQSGVGAGVHRFRVPWSDVLFVARASGLGNVNSQSRCRRRKEGRRVPDYAAISALPPQPGVLHDVLGLDRASKHAVRDAE